MIALLKTIDAVDVSISERFARFIKPAWARILVVALNHTGDGLVLLPAGALLWFCGHGAVKATGFYMSAATLATWAVAGIFKFTTRRKRPAGRNDHLYNTLDKYSFPSGHATRISCTIVLLAALVPVQATAGLVIWGIIVLLGRIALCVHYTSDILGGIVIGTMTGVLIGCVC
jgi:undecaprenyl-diphosphatase